MGEKYGDNGVKEYLSRFAAAIYAPVLAKYGIKNDEDYFETDQANAARNTLFLKNKSSAL